jgi:ribosomal protein S18 acetylase RimI-like enzyme
MPEVEIRPVVSGDIPHITSVDHDYTSTYVWQMDLIVEEGQMGINFRHVRLPRSVRVDYPRPFRQLAENWEKRDGLLAAVLSGEIVGYCGLGLSVAPKTTWVTDLAVSRRVRRQGIASTLLLAVQDWAREHATNRIVMEMQPKNHPAYCLSQKLGFDFCGYDDRYYPNRDIGLFFGKSIR